MSNWIASYNDKWKNYTIYTSDADAEYPASNVTTRALTEQCHLIRLSDSWLKIIGTSIVLDTIFLFGCNFTSSVTLKIQGSNDNFSTSPAYDQSFLYNATTGIAAYKAASQQSYDAWRVLATDASNPDGVLKVGRVFHGTMWEPDYGYNGRASDNIIDQSIKNIMDSRQAFTIFKEKYNTWYLPFDMIDGDEMKAFFNSVGEGAEWIMTKKPWDSIYTYGNIADNSYYVSLDKYSQSRVVANWYKMILDIEEES